MAARRSPSAGALPVTALAARARAASSSCSQIGGRRWDDDHVARPVLLDAARVLQPSARAPRAATCAVGVARRRGAQRARHRLDNYAERHHRVRQLGRARRSPAPVLFAQRAAQPRAAQPRAAREGARSSSDEPRRRGGERRARGAHADRRRAARRRRPRAQRDDRAGGGRAAAGRARPGARRGRVRDRRGDRARGAHRAAPPARRAAPRGRGARRSRRSRASPTSARSCAARARPGCRSSCASRASRGRCRPASTSPPTGSCRRRSAARATPRPAAPRVTLRYGASDLRVEIADDGAPDRAPAARPARARRRSTAARSRPAPAGGPRAGASPRGCRSAAPTAPGPALETAA